MSRRRLALAAVVAFAVLVPSSASALDECRGLPQCVSVVGPWVAVPANADGRVVSVQWELRCPVRGYVVGGTDARVASRDLEVSIRGETGSPVAPGVTTRRAVLFTAQTAAPGPATAFVPAIGCLPGAGGGGRSLTATRAVFKPGTPLVRRVATVRVPAGATRAVVARCPRGTRLVESSHAVGFRTVAPPTQALLGSVSATEARSATLVRVTAVRAAATGTAPVVLVQAHAICAKGSA